MGCSIHSTMTTTIIAVFTLALATSAFAGRAFPVNSENFVVDLFSQENPNLAWDESNYVVDLSGRYAVCKNQAIDGFIDVTETTPEGSPITGLVASYPGDASDADSVNAYIAESMPQWLINPTYTNQIKSADKFGCSIQPSCGQGNYVVACLFTSDGTGDSAYDNRIEDNFQEFKGPETEQVPAPYPQIGEPKSRAFTPEQYDVAEEILRQEWDRSHFLENLSGQEADCKMVTDKNWKFSTAKEVADEKNMDIETFHGVTENEGETEPAMVAILKTWQKYDSRDSEIGCSIIPDCMNQGKMFVVVVCIRGFGNGNDNEVGEFKGKEPVFITLPVPTEPKAYAFTPEQYAEAEKIFGKKWDASHFLENLSGKETDCEMLRSDVWGFPIVKAEAQIEGVKMEPVFGATMNTGSTDEAIKKILKSINTPQTSGKVGCSVMPDCQEARGMFTVVSCVFSE